MARVAALFVLAALAGCAAPGPQSAPPPEVLLDAYADTVGAPVRYPVGRAHVLSLVLTMVPGQETGWHRHDVPLFARMLDGEIEVDYGTGTVKRYRAGETFLEAMDRYHNGRVVGDATVRILIVFMGADGVANTEMRK